MALAFALSEPASAVITPSPIFLATLIHERKRAERSGRSFLLALIKGASFQEVGGHALAQAIGASISSRMRATDSLGWYEQGHTLGVLFTEIGEVDSAKLENLSQKIFAAIRQAVSLEDFSRLQIALRVLPQYAADGSPDNSWEELIYRELHHEPAATTNAQTIKRLVDIVGSSFFLVMFLPAFALICLLIKATSRGPVFFCQKRVGRYGRLFTFYKFRSMYADNDATLHRDYVTQLIGGKARPEVANGMYKLVDDPRVTPLGRMLRKTSLDELPQFVNVLLGDMSLVGPRPPIPYEFACYRPWHKQRLIALKPGLTGIWQVHGRSRTTFDEMVRMDLRYARTQSLLLDLKLLLQTPAAMFFGRGAY